MRRGKTLPRRHSNSKSFLLWQFIASSNPRYSTSSSDRNRPAHLLASPLLSPPTKSRQAPLAASPLEPNVVDAGVDSSPSRLLQARNLHSALASTAIQPAEDQPEHAEYSARQEDLRSEPEPAAATIASRLLPTHTKLSTLSILTPYPALDGSSSITSSLRAPLLNVIAKVRRHAHVSDLFLCPLSAWHGSYPGPSICATPHAIRPAFCTL